MGRICNRLHSWEALDLVLHLGRRGVGHWMLHGRILLKYYHNQNFYNFLNLFLERYGPNTWFPTKKRYGRYLVSGHRGVAYLWDLGVGGQYEAKRVLPLDHDFDKADIRCVKFHPTTSCFAGSLGDRAVAMWDIGKAGMVRLVPTAHACTSMAWSPNGIELACGLTNGDLAVYDMRRSDLVLNYYADGGGGIVNSNLSNSAEVTSSSGPVHSVEWLPHEDSIACDIVANYTSSTTQNDDINMDDVNNTGGAGMSNHATCNLIAYGSHYGINIVPREAGCGGVSASANSAGSTEMQLAGSTSALGLAIASSNRALKYPGHKILRSKFDFASSTLVTLGVEAE